VITLRPPRRRDVLKIVRLSDEIFGEGYLIEEDVNDRYIVLTVDGTLAGFANTDIWDDEGALDATGFALGLIETVAIRPSHRGLRLGDILISVATSTLIYENVNVVECYATTWSDSKVCFIRGALERNGFEVGQHFPRMWENDNQDFICRACKKQPCICDATLYRREVNKQGE